MNLGARNLSHMAARALSVLLACAVGLLLLNVPSLAAAPYNWTGGHDVLGWPAPSKTMYFAEGCTRNGIEEYLIVRNPGAVTSRVTLMYLFPSEGALKQTMLLAPLEGRSINVNGIVGRDKDVSIVLTADPGIIAEREMYFNYKGVWTGGHDVVGFIP